MALAAPKSAATPAPIMATAVTRSAEAVASAEPWTAEVSRAPGRAHGEQPWWTLVPHGQRHRGRPTPQPRRPQPRLNGKGFVRAGTVTVEPRIRTRTLHPFGGGCAPLGGCLGSARGQQTPRHSATVRSGLTRPEQLVLPRFLDTDALIGSPGRVSRNLVSHVRSLPGTCGTRPGKRRRSDPSPRSRGAPLGSGEEYRTARDRRKGENSDRPERTGGNRFMQEYRPRRDRQSVRQKGRDSGHG